MKINSRRILMLLFFVFLVIFLSWFRVLTTELKMNPEAWQDHPNRKQITSTWKSRESALSGKKDWLFHWLGIEMIQEPYDLMIYQDIITDLRPDYIIEMGTYRGGLTFFLASLMESHNLSGKVLSVDIDDGLWNETLAKVNTNPRVKERIHFMKGSSTDPLIYQEIQQIVGDKKVLIILDSLHTKEHVQKELEMYQDLVSIGGYILVNDTTLGGPYLDLRNWRLTKIGPLYGVRNFLRENHRFIQDREKEKYLSSCMYSGILKKVS